MSKPDRGLQPGDEIQCPHCREWHRVEYTPNRASIRSEAVRAMLYYTCMKAKHPGWYYAGSVGTLGKLKHRKAKG